MAGDSGGAAVRGETAAGAQGPAGPEAQVAQVAAGGVGGAAGDVGVGGDSCSVTGVERSDVAARARADHEAALVERDARIAELEGEIAEAT